MADDPQPPPDEAIQAGIEQFQRAALEAVRAGRAMLDAAESVLQDPRAAETLARTVSHVARTATETVSGLAARGWPGRTGEGGADDHDDPDDPDEGPSGRFERISVD